MIRGILFDLGDTLYDLGVKNHLAALAEGIGGAYDMLKSRGFALPPKEKYCRKVVRAVIARYAWSHLTSYEINLATMIYNWHRRRGMRLSDEDVVRYAEECHLPFRQEFKPTAGCRDTLECIHAAGYPMVLISNTFMLGRILDDDLRSGGVLDYFKARVYSADVGYMKPNRRIFECAIAKLGVQPQETMMVGDLIGPDVKGAKRFGMTTVLRVSNGRLPAGRVRPDFVIRKLPEILSLLPGCRVRCTAC